MIKERFLSTIMKLKKVIVKMTHQQSSLYSVEVPGNNWVVVAAVLLLFLRLY